MSLTRETDKAILLKTLQLLTKALDEAKAERQFLEEQLATLQDQLKRSRRALKGIVISGLGGELQTFEAKKFLKSGRAVK